MKMGNSCWVLTGYPIIPINHMILIYISRVTQIRIYTCAVQCTNFHNDLDRASAQLRTTLSEVLTPKTRVTIETELIRLDASSSIIQNSHTSKPYPLTNKIASVTRLRLTSPFYFFYCCLLSFVCSHLMTIFFCKICKLFFSLFL